MAEERTPLLSNTESSTSAETVIDMDNYYISTDPDEDDPSVGLLERNILEGDDSGSGETAARDLGGGDAGTKLSPTMIRTYRQFLSERQQKYRRNKRKDRTESSSIILQILYSDTNQYRSIKMLLCFPLGLLIGFLIYILITGITFALFASVRCVTFLLLPLIFSNKGQLCFSAIAIVLIIVGPVNTMLAGGREVGRVVVCNFELVYNQTKSQLELRMMPIIDVLISITAQADKLRGMAVKLVNRFFPLRQEVADENDDPNMAVKYGQLTSEEIQSASLQRVIDEREAQRGNVSSASNIAASYQKKLNFRCTDILDQGVAACKQKFADAYDRCIGILGRVIGFIMCLVVRLDCLCEIILIVPGILGFQCSSKPLINPSFTQTFQMADKLSSSLDSEFSANLQYQAADPEGSESTFQWTFDDLKHAMEAEMTWRQEIAEFILACINRLVVLMFLLLIYSAHDYNDQYVCRIDFDNIYVTSYFRHIDLRRKAQGKLSLLPLKKLEEKDIVILTEARFNDEELRRVVVGTAMFFSRAFLYGFFVMLDWIFSDILDIYAKHGKIDFHQEGVQHIAMIIDGTGIIAVLIRALLGGFNKTYSLDSITSNEECLPKVQRTSLKILVFLLLNLVGSWFLVILQAYGLRTRRLVAGFFYRKREKQRILHLYNEMLRRRQGFLRRARRRIRKKVQENTLGLSVSFLTALRSRFPTCCGCLYGVFGVGKNRCLICDDPETPLYVYCLTPNCRGVYCPTCWKDIKMKCYVCRPDDEWSLSSGSS